VKEIAEDELLTSLGSTIENDRSARMGCHRSAARERAPAHWAL